MTTLDIKDCKLNGLELMEEIENRFNSTQSILVQPYPHELLMTGDQYVNLMTIAGLIEEMEGSSEDHYYRTKEGYVMEVRIDYV